MKNDGSADNSITNTEYSSIQKEDSTYASYAKMRIVCTAFHNYRMESSIFRLYWNLKQWRKNVFS
jgi:hypothetical protein